MPQYRRKGLKRTGRGLKQKGLMGAYPSVGSGLAAAVKTGIFAAGVTNTGRKIANRLMNMRKQAQSLTQTIQKKKEKKSANYGLMTEHSRTIDLSKKLTTVGKLNKYVRSNLQYVIYRWNGIKSFDNNGYYWFSNFTTASVQRALSLYLFDLTSCRNSVSGTTTAANPLVQAYMNPTNGTIYFVPRANINNAGVGTNQLQLENAPSSTASVYSPNAGDILKWVNIQMNLWGCKNRSTKFLIKIVRFKEADLAPAHDETSASGNDQRTALFQSIIKPYVFNPLAKTSQIHLNKIYTYKSQSYVIDSTMTTETDSDPHVKTVKMYVKLDRSVNYADSSAKLATDVAFADEADFVENTNTQQFRTQTDPQSRLYLMVMASNYVADTEETHADTPSFDLQVQMKHQNFN